MVGQRFISNSLINAFLKKKQDERGGERYTQETSGKNQGVEGRQQKEKKEVEEDEGLTTGYNQNQALQVLHKTTKKRYTYTYTLTDCEPQSLFRLCIYSIQTSQHRLLCCLKSLVAGVSGS